MNNINPHASFPQMDIRDATLPQVFEKERPEVICHLVAQYSVKISTDGPVRDEQVNIWG